MGTCSPRCHAHANTVDVQGCRQAIHDPHSHTSHRHTLAIPGRPTRASPRWHIPIQVLTAIPTQAHTGIYPCKPKQGYL
eukprot:352281-Chlamydomonas_euryale.AAC.4